MSAEGVGDEVLADLTDFEVRFVWFIGLMMVMFFLMVCRIRGFGTCFDGLDRWSSTTYSHCSVLRGNWRWSSLPVQTEAMNHD